MGAEIQPKGESNSEQNQVSWRSMTASTGALHETTILDFFENAANRNDVADGDPVSFSKLSTDLEPLSVMAHKAHHVAHRGLVGVTETVGVEAHAERLDIFCKVQKFLYLYVTLRILTYLSASAVLILMWCW
jgi:hypothetical protein